MNQKIKNISSQKFGGYIIIFSMIIFGSGIAAMPLTSMLDNSIRIIPMFGILIGAPFIALGLHFYHNFINKSCNENPLITSGVVLISWGFLGIFIHWCLEASVLTGKENIIHVSSIGYEEIVSEISTPISLFSGAIVWAGFTLVTITSALILNMSRYEYWFSILSGIYSILATIIHYIQVFFSINQMLFSGLLSISLISLIIWGILMGSKMIKES
ncbi:MAG: hypothetical protein ACJ0BE_00070 [Dehalococcoidia bacterium]